MADVDYDVVVLGGGPVGLAVAAALGHEGLGVALLERAALGAYDGPRSADDWDGRVYALSPGSADFLRGLGAWQRLPAERIAAVEMMDVHGDEGGAIVFSAYDLGERALAWIVENRELCATLVEAVRTCAPVAVLAPCEPTAITWRADGRRPRSPRWRPSSPAARHRRATTSALPSARFAFRSYYSTLISGSSGLPC